MPADPAEGWAALARLGVALVQVALLVAAIVVAGALLTRVPDLWRLFT